MKVSETGKNIQPYARFPLPCYHVSLAIRWKDVSTQWVMSSIPSPAERQDLQCNLNCGVWFAG